jgi:hypothetical protein
MSRDDVQLPRGYIVITGVLEVQGRELFVYSVLDGHSSSSSEQVTKDKLRGYLYGTVVRCDRQETFSYFWVSKSR